MLIASDKYGGVGKDSKTLSTLSAALRSVVDTNRERKPLELCAILMATIRNLLLTRYRNTAKKGQVELLCDDLEKRLLSPKDFEVFVLTCEAIMIPINE